MNRARVIGSAIASLFYTLVLAMVIVLICFTLVDKKADIPSEEQEREQSGQLDALGTTE